MKRLAIQIKEHHSKIALAVMAHLRQIARTVFDEAGSGRAALRMNHADLLLCSASLRALLFDRSSKPVLLSFLDLYNIRLDIEAIETDLAMLLFAQTDAHENGHISDICMGLLLRPELHTEFEQAGRVLIVGGRNPTYDNLMRKPKLWRPEPTDTHPDLYVGASNEGPIQMATFKKVQVPIEDWGGIRFGFLKNIPIRRENLICYTANQIGGVHYDPNHLPKNQEERNEFKVLAQVFDWEERAVMHAGLVAVAIACFELITNPTILSLFDLLQSYHQQRQADLLSRACPPEGPRFEPAIG